jgi:hypothetical protein
MNFGNFVPPLISRAFESINVDVCLDRSLACRSQFHDENVGTKDISIPSRFEKIQQLQIKLHQVGVASENLVTFKFG